MAPQYYNSEEERPIYDHDLHITERPINNKKTIGVVAGLAVIIIGLSVLCRFAPHKNPYIDTSFIAKTPMAACSTVECFATNCDKQLAPFLCTSGRSHGGCSDIASTWVNNDICTKSCDLRDCDLHAVVEDEDNLPRHCNDCNEQQCDFLAKQFFQSCGSEAPYVCLSNSNMYGCAKNKYTWEAAVNTTCGSCCDKRSCDK